MKLAVLSDIHGNLGALQAVLADVRKRGADVIVNLGDILSGPLEPAETADVLMALALPAIRGNHERQLLEASHPGPSDRYALDVLRPEHLAWIEALPASLKFSDDVLLCHGTPDSDLEYFLEEVIPSGVRPAAHALVAERAGGAMASLILCGHTHVPRAVRLDDGRLIVNPGSVGLQAYDWDVPLPHVIANGTPHARYAMLERKAAEWSVEFIALDYDWERAARQAEARSRPDWAIALRTGHC